MSTEQPPAPALEIMPSMQLLAEAAQEQEKLPEGGVNQDTLMDERSSSLSELEDRPGMDLPEDEGSELENEEDDNDEEEDDVEAEDQDDDPEEDTEAETERLHGSPEKRRNVHHRIEDGLQLPDDNIDQTSDISALSDYDAGDISRLDSPVSSPRKRKRDEQESDEEDVDHTQRSLKRVSRKLEDHAIGSEEEAEQIDAEATLQDMDEAKEEDEEVSGDEHLSSKEPTPEGDAIARVEPEDEAEVSEAEGAEAETEEAEADLTAKDEEDPARKATALESLRCIEKDFAVLRDKLFAEKMAELNSQTELLQSNPLAHPEYASAVEAIDQRRDKTFKLARTTLKYKLDNTKTKAIADSSMAHSQYMQEVAQIRELALDDAGAEWYRVQRERRALPDEEVERKYHFNPDRAVQVARQHAYNLEVSIESGIQAHVGFPAAPEIEGAAPNEIEEDLRKMGISTKPAHNLPRAAPISSFPRHRPTPNADETFLERNPWANPQHAYHAQLLTAQQQQPHSQTQPQLQQLPSTGSYTTPAAPRRQPEPPPQGSASTVAASSVEQTPMNSQVQVGNVQRSVPIADGMLETPSRPPPKQNGNLNNYMNSSYGALGASRQPPELSPRSSPLKPPQVVSVVPAGSN